MQNKVTVITNIYKVLSNPVVYTLLNTLFDAMRMSDITVKYKNQTKSYSQAIL